MEAIAGEGLLCLKLLGCNTRIHFQCNKVLTDNLGLRLDSSELALLLEGHSLNWYSGCIHVSSR